MESFCKILMSTLNWELSNDVKSDWIRKVIGYLPIMWIIIDDFCGPQITVKKKFKCFDVKEILFIVLQYFVLLEMAIAFVAGNVTWYLIPMAFGISYYLWLKFGKDAWIKGRSSTLINISNLCTKESGPKGLKIFILNASVVLALICLYVKYESIVLFVALITTGIIFHQEERIMAFLLALLTSNLPIFVLAIISKYPVTSFGKLSKYNLYFKNWYDSYKTLFNLFYDKSFKFNFPF